MKKITLQIITIAFVFCLAGMAKASLLNDEVEVEFHWPNFGTVYVDGGQHLVEAGSADAFLFYFDVFEVNLEASSVILDFQTSFSSGSYAFAGLVLSDLDYELGYILLGVDVDTNMAGWDDNRIIFGDDYVGFNWQSLEADSNTDFTAFFEFGPNPIP